MISLCVEQIEIYFNIHWKYMESTLITPVNESSCQIFSMNQLIQFPENMKRLIDLTDFSDSQIQLTDSMIRSHWSWEILLNQIWSYCMPSKDLKYSAQQLVWCFYILFDARNPHL